MFSYFHVLFCFSSYNSVLRNPLSIFVRIKNLYMQHHLCNQRIACFPLHSLFRLMIVLNRSALSLLIRLRSEGCNRTIVPTCHHLKYKYNCLSDSLIIIPTDRKIPGETERQRERERERERQRDICISVSLCLNRINKFGSG